MPLAQSKLTVQGQISIPAEIRKKLGIGPGSTIEWEEEDGKIVVRRAAQQTFEQLRQKLFPNGPPKRRSIVQMDEGIEENLRKEHARGRY